MKTIFKVGDKVFDIRHGWGEVVEHFNGDYLIKFQSVTNAMLSNEIAIKMVSFTEYTLDGFSQERPEELPEKGQIVWAREAYKSYWEIGHFYEKKDGRYLLSSGRTDGWSFGGVEITTKNPYENKES